MTKIHSHTHYLVDLEKRKMCSGQYDAPPPSGGDTWTQSQKQIRTKIQSEQMTKAGKSDEPDTTVCILMGDIDQDTATDLQQFLKDKDQKWLKVTPQIWAY